MHVAIDGMTERADQDTPLAGDALDPGQERDELVERQAAAVRAAADPPKAPGHGIRHEGVGAALGWPSDKVAQGRALSAARADQGPIVAHLGDTKAAFHFNSRVSHRASPVVRAANISVGRSCTPRTSVRVGRGDGVAVRLDRVRYT
jgi:hypothetical protein